MATAPLWRGLPNNCIYSHRRSSRFSLQPGTSGAAVPGERPVDLTIDPKPAERIAGRQGAEVRPLKKAPRKAPNKEDAA